MTYQPTTGWNYRLVRSKKWGLGIHEVYYSGDGNPISCTDDPITLVGDNAKELKAELKSMKKAFTKEILDMSFFENLNAQRSKEFNLIQLLRGMMGQLTKGEIVTYKTPEHDCVFEKNFHIAKEDKHCRFCEDWKQAVDLVFSWRTHEDGDRR